MKNVTFANTSGWITFEDNPEESEPIDVTDTVTNATNLTSDYKNYYWERS